jgi:nicotinamide riboside kinase
VAEALVVAIVGAECTGKTTLAQALRDRLVDETGLAVAVVGEWLRTWCNREGRTPRPDEQRGIARHQHGLIAAAAEAADLVVCDTTALTTAVYSRVLFDDRALEPMALALHRDVSLTLLTALDLPWEADGFLRDGVQVQQPVDDALRELLGRSGRPWVTIGGTGARRLEAALDAVAPLLRSRPTPRQGLFTRLREREAAQAPWPWVCDCDDPGCEHAARRLAGARAR